MHHFELPRFQAEMKVSSGLGQQIQLIKIRILEKMLTSFMDSPLSNEFG